MGTRTSPTLIFLLRSRNFRDILRRQMIWAQIMARSVIKSKTCAEFTANSNKLSGSWWSLTWYRFKFIGEYSRRENIHQYLTVIFCDSSFVGSCSWDIPDLMTLRFQFSFFFKSSITSSLACLDIDVTTEAFCLVLSHIFLTYWYTLHFSSSASFCKLL